VDLVAGTTDPPGVSMSKSGLYHRIAFRPVEQAEDPTAQAPASKNP
jgi:hypothetical protein